LESNSSVHLLVLFITSVFMLLISNISVAEGDSIGEAYTIMDMSGLPIDNILQYLLADKMITGQSTIPFIGDWLASDRPPMGAAYYMFIYVFTPIDADVMYQSSAVVLLSTWVWALYSLMRFLGSSLKNICFVYLLMLLTTALLLTLFSHGTKLLPLYFSRFWRSAIMK